jgi:hypothetical protein
MISGGEGRGGSIRIMFSSFAGSNGLDAVGWISLLEKEVKPLLSPRRRDGLRTELSIIPE